MSTYIFFPLDGLSPYDRTFEFTRIILLLGNVSSVKPLPFFLVCGRESLTYVLRALKFVDHGDGVVFHRDSALADFVHQQRVFSYAERARALTGREQISCGFGKALGGAAYFMK
jgi:hypothetical protein